MVMRSGRDGWKEGVMDRWREGGKEDRGREAGSLRGWEAGREGGGNEGAFPLSLPSKAPYT